MNSSLALWADWLAGIPVIILMLHKRDTWKGGVHILIDKCLANATDRVITNSEAVRDFAIGHENHLAERVTVIYNGIDMTGFRVIDSAEDRDVLNKEFVVGTVGRLAKQKGFRYLIEASDIVQAQRNDVKFLIVGGDAHPKESVSDELFRLNRGTDKEEDKVIFTGHRKDIPQILSL